MSGKIEFCPGCNSKLTAGWIGERGRIRWYDKPWRIHALFNQGESLLTYKWWAIKFNEQEAKRCFHCGLVLFKSEPVEKKTSSVRAIQIILVLAPFLLFICLIPNFFSWVFPPRPSVPEMVKTMGNISATDGFRYFSGYYGVRNNLPAIYAHGHSTIGDKLTIVGPGMEQEFSIQQMDKALSGYKEFLAKRGYYIR
jgi:hypothetical protein